MDNDRVIDREATMLSTVIVGNFRNAMQNCAKALPFATPPTKVLISNRIMDGMINAVVEIACHLAGGPATAIEMAIIDNLRIKFTTIRNRLKEEEEASNEEEKG